MRRLLSLSLALPLIATSLGCPDGPGDGPAGEGEGEEGEGEGGGDAFTLVKATDVTGVTDLQVVPGFAVATRSDGRFVVAWFEHIAETVECEVFNGDPVQGEVYRLVVGEEEADGSVTTAVVDDFVPNVKEDSIDLAIDGQDRILAAYLGGEVTPTFCGGSDLMLAVENGATFNVETIATVSGTSSPCRGSAGGDPYCAEGDVVGLYPSISVDGDEVVVTYLDTHFGFADTDITATDLELARGTPGAFALSSINMESGGGYYDDCTLTADGEVLVGHNVTANNQFVDDNDVPFVVEDGIYAEVVDATGAVINSSVLLPGVFTASRVATAAFPGKGLFVAVHNRSDESLLLFNSVDHGANWTPSPIEQLGRTGRDPSLLFTDDGRLVAVYGHCRDNTNQDGCDAKDDGVRFALRKDDGRYTKFTVDGDSEDLEAIGIDATRAPGDQIVTVSLNASQNRLTVHRVQVN